MKLMKGEKTKAYLCELIKEKNIPYLDIIVKKEHETILRCYDSREKKATGKENIFLFSCTKPMTVACVLHLVEEGKLSLDDEVAKYLPAYANTFLKNGEKTKNKMRIQHLLAMTGGLSYRLPQPVKDLLIQTENKATTIEVVSQFIKEPLQFEPGERFEYSFCHDVLAAVIEVVSGKRFSEYMREVFFLPLGMQSTGFHTEQLLEMQKLYQAKTSGEIVEIPIENEFVFGENYDSGGAGIISTVEDYARFVDLMACGGESENGYRLLKKKTVKLLRQETIASLGLDNSFTCVQGDDYGYGLGVRVRKKETSWGLPVGEFGWDGAAGTYIMADPINKISVVIGMHLRGWTNVFKGEHLRLVQCVYEDMKEERIL